MVPQQSMGLKPRKLIARRNEFGRWLLEEGITYQEVSDALRINPFTIRKFSTRIRRPNPDVIRQIEKMTEGRVREEHWPRRSRS